MVTFERIVDQVAKPLLLKIGELLERIDVLEARIAELESRQP